jgi:transposase-like protein
LKGTARFRYLHIVRSLPQHLRRRWQATNVIERVFVGVRRWTRPMVCFVNVARVDRILYSTLH